MRLAPDLAQDAVHDVFVSLLETPEIFHRVVSLDQDSAFRYLFVAAYRRALRELERQHHDKRQPEELLSTLTTIATPEYELSAVEAEDALRLAFDRLKSPYREVLELVLIQRKNYQEISERLNRPMNTIYQQTQRGLQRLFSEIRRSKSPKTS